jgi:hypothetical protein
MQVASIPSTPSTVQVASVPAAPQVSTVATSVQSTKPPRAHIVMGWDVCRIPIPYPRFYAIPGEQEVVTTTEYSNVASQANTSAVATVPQYQVIPQTPVATVPTAVAAVQQPQYFAPATAPTQVVAVQSAPPAPQNCQPQVTQQQVEEMTRKLQMLERLLQEREASQSSDSRGFRR